MDRKVFSFLINGLRQIKLPQFLLTLFFILFFCSHAHAIDYTLSWDANTEPDIAGYRVYYKAGSSGQPSGDYDVVIDVGNFTLKTIEGLEEGIVYYFAVTAYDMSGLESAFSEEIKSPEAPVTTTPDPVVITLPDAGSIPYLLTKGNKPDSLALYVEGGSISEGFNWSLTLGSVGSLSEVTNERTVIYTAPSSIARDLAIATVILRNDAGTILGRQTITVYNAVTVTNKLSSDETVYTGEATEFTVQGGDGSYTWTVTKNGGLVDLYSGKSYVFDATGDGAAGTYIIVVTDGNNFTDSFNVSVLENTSVPTGNNTQNELKDISGYIVNENGAGIANVNVILLSPKRYINSTTTGTDGSFLFSNIPAVNKYHFSAIKNGYVSTEFSSDDLLSGNSQNNIILKSADTYIAGEITIDGVAFSGEPVEVTISYIINGFGLLAGKAISSNGSFRIDFEEVLGVSEYILTAARSGEYGDTAVRSLPGNGVIIDINTSLEGDDVNALAGGSSYPVSIAGQSVSIVRVPFGSIDPADGVTDIYVDITTVANSNSTYTSGSGNWLYSIDMDFNDITTILTLPFNLARVAPGDFENGNAVIYHADTKEELISGTNLKEISADDIISIDYVGDGSTGLVEFYTDSLSVFGVGSTSTDDPSVGSISTQSPSGEDGGGGGCFIDTLADTIGSSDGFYRMLVLFGVILMIGLMSRKLKTPR